MNTKITITNELRSIVIPLEYEESTDSLTINEIQIDPMPEKSEDISKDIALNLAKAIMNMFEKMNN